MQVNRKVNALLMREIVEGAGEEIRAHVKSVTDSKKAELDALERLEPETIPWVETINGVSREVGMKIRWYLDDEVIVEKLIPYVFEETQDE